MRKVHLLLSSARPTFQPFVMSHRALRATRIPPFTFVEPLFGLRHHQRDIIGSVLQDVHRGGVREALEVHVVHREEAVTCESDGKKIRKGVQGSTESELYSHTHTGGKREAETQRPTRFEAPVDISRAAGSDGADDGAEIGAARVLSTHDLEPWRRKIKQMSTSAETLKCQLLIYVGGGD